MGTDVAAGSRMAIVCGSDSPAGGALTARLREAGFDVVTVDMTGVAPHPSANVSLDGDLLNESAWSEIAARARSAGRAPEMLVYAIDPTRSGLETSAMTQADWDDVLARNLRRAFLACRYLMPLLDGDRAAVVLAGSVLAQWDTRSDAAFGASQAGMLALARSLALSGAADGIRVNSVCLGLVADPANAVADEVLQRIPLGRAADPDDAADAVLFLLSSDAAHVSGSALVVDGGQSLQSWSNTPEQLYPLNPVRERPSIGTPRFAGRTVLITGAGGGIGSAAARRFSSEGASVALLDRDGPAAEAVAHELIAGGGQALALEADVAHDAALERAFQRAEQHFGRLDVVFNNAGVSADATAADMPVELWDEVLAINLRGVFLGSRLAVAALRRAGGGVIVNMGSSTAWHDTITGGAAYMASKAAVEALTRSLALQGAPLGIRATAVSPGVIQTPLSVRRRSSDEQGDYFRRFAERIPRGRVGQPEDVAGPVAFLASDQARHITGTSLLIDGGQTLRRWLSAPDLGPALPW